MAIKSDRGRPLDEKFNLHGFASTARSFLLASMPIKLDLCLIGGRILSWILITGILGSWDFGSPDAVAIFWIVVLITMNSSTNNDNREKAQEKIRNTHGHEICIINWQYESNNTILSLADLIWMDTPHHQCWKWLKCTQKFRDQLTLDLLLTRWGPSKHRIMKAKEKYPEGQTNKTRTTISPKPTKKNMYMVSRK